MILLVALMARCAHAEPELLCSYAENNKEMNEDEPFYMTTCPTDGYVNLQWEVEEFETKTDGYVQLTAQFANQGHYKFFEIDGKTSFFTALNGNPVEFDRWDDTVGLFGPSVEFKALCIRDNMLCSKPMKTCDCRFDVKWKLYGDLPAPPSPPPLPPVCDAVDSVSGYWVQVASCSGCGGSFKESVGTQISTGQTTSRSWQNSVTNSITKGVEVSASIGFSLGKEGVGGISGSISGSIGTTSSRSNTFTKTTASSLATAASQSFQKSIQSEHGRSYSGWLWQFQFKVDDTCGGAIIRTNHFAQTSSGTKPPCCIPTYIKDAEHPHGACTDIEGCLSNVGECDVATCATPPPAPPPGPGDDTKHSGGGEGGGISGLPEPDSDVQIGPIIGGAVGGVVATFVFVLVLVYLLKKRAQPKVPPACPPVTVGVEVHAAAPPPAGSARLST